MDGNDILAVVRATREAVEHARAGNGPVLIEAKTMRMLRPRAARCRGLRTPGGSRGLEAARPHRAV